MKSESASLSEFDYILSDCSSISDESIVLFEQNLNMVTFRNREYEEKHNPFDQEQREMAAIRNGSTEDLKKSWAESYTGHIGKLAENELRQAQNHAIVLVSLASRMAMASGLLPEISYSLSDIYICEIEKQKRPEKAFLLGRQAEYHYTLLVAQTRKVIRTEEDTDPRTDDIKAYIFAHLHESIRLNDLASQLVMSKTYLCDFFKKQTGLTIGTYIRQQKINAVCNMLKYSDYTYSEIATYFGYSSQSHLGQQFRKETGLTLRSYRLKYRRKE